MTTLGPPPRLSPPEVALPEVVHTGGMDGPEVALAVSGTAILHEALIEREVVADGVLPRLVVHKAIIGEVGGDVLVDIAQEDALLRGVHDGL